MSLRRPLINFWMRQVEKPAMARAKDAAALRRSLELKAKFLFHAPRGTQQNWLKLSSASGVVDALEVRPKKPQAKRVILYIHGGAFVFGSPRTHAAMMAQLARRTGARVFLPQYRLAPEAPFPAAKQDLRQAWDGLLAQGIAPSDIVLGGDSAGGALALGLLAELCADGADGPAALFGFSPLTDMAHSSESFTQNARREAVLPASRAAECSEAYLGGCDPADPAVSPVHADFTGAPPVWITVGDTEILRDDAHAIAARLRECGVTVQLDEKHDLPHVWPILHNILPEARQTLDDLASWIRQLPERPSES